MKEKDSRRGFRSVVAQCGSGCAKGFGDAEERRRRCRLPCSGLGGLNGKEEAMGL